MTYHFNVTGADRKKLVNFIGENIGQTPKYLGAPSFAYQIGGYNLSKDGTLTWADLDDVDPAHMEESYSLIQALEIAGFHSDEATFFEEQKAAIEEECEEADHEDEDHDATAIAISMPASMFSESAIGNLQALIQSKGTLMKRAFQTENLEIQIDKEKVSFPWFSTEDPEELAAYTLFIQKICEMAINQRRISAKEKEIINEKYEFRCFLLRLGLIGDESKNARKILMKHLNGSAAFKSPAAKGGEQA